MKTTLRFCLTPVRIAIIKNTANNRVGGTGGPNNECTYEYMNKEKIHSLKKRGLLFL
jgi:hypothetical protein